MSNSVTQQRASELMPEDVPVSAEMIEAGLEILEEIDERPLSRIRVERAFQAMYLCGFQESGRGS